MFQLSGKRIFITGLAGFLGSHIADRCLAEGYRVSGCDNLTGGYLDNVPSGAVFHQIDCNDFAPLAALMREVDIVYHCAATAYEGLSVFSPPHLVTRNVVTATSGVVSAATAGGGVKRFVLCSSMARYGTNEVPFTEDMVPAPQDPYASPNGVRNGCLPILPTPTVWSGWWRFLTISSVRGSATTTLIATWLLFSST